MLRFLRNFALAFAFYFVTGATLLAIASEKEPRGPFDYSITVYAWVIGWAVLGGIVNFYQKLKAGVVRVFNLTEFVGEVFTSGFVGLLTFWMCERAQLDGFTSAVLIGISGHMGSRVLFIAEKLLEKKLRAFIKSFLDEKLEP